MSDLISRQAVIEINQSYHGQMPNEVNHRIWKEINELPSAEPDNDMIHLQKEQAYLQGWEEGREALRKEMWENGRDRLD